MMGNRLFFSFFFCWDSAEEEEGARKNTRRRETERKARRRGTLIMKGSWRVVGWLVDLILLCCFLLLLF